MARKFSLSLSLSLSLSSEWNGTKHVRLPCCCDALPYTMDIRGMTETEARTQFLERRGF